MKTFARLLIALLCAGSEAVSAQALKSIVYDFDGLDIGQTDLPEGDYRVNDLTYQVAANPLAASDVIGDRVLKVNLNWSTNYGAFGRGISRYIEFNQGQDRINFFFYNPYSNNQSAYVDVVLADDDNQNLYYDNAGDDTWKKSLVLNGSAGWQLVSVPLSEFSDINTGGNGIFDIAFTQNKGMLLFAELRFFKTTSASNATFYVDYIHFSEGSMPQGATALDLPYKQNGDYALLGAFVNKSRGSEHEIPGAFESLFPASTPPKKIRYANWFLHWATNGGTTPHQLPGAEVQHLLNNGYRPLITWEPMYQGYDRLHASQPRLSGINNGNYDWYIDQFANKIKSYNDTIIIRFMHEFEGDWYPWSIVHNNNDPQAYVNAFRRVVNRFRAAGATKVKWMWCVNSDYAPYRHYNYIVPAYPGNEYVDIVATDIYNNHYPENLPWWRSFRWQTAETYYYLTKHFSQKPLYICEVGCRERFSSENSSSESKGAWYAKMDRELQTYFRKVRGLIFFHANPDQNWLVNSSSSALQSLTSNVWNDPYYWPQSSPPPPPPPSACTGTGGLSREVWTNIIGGSVSYIPVNDPPSSVETITSFQSVPNTGDNYGQRVRGYICPPVSGNYVFWIASDDNSELWLSTNDQPAGRVKIAYMNGWTMQGEYTKYATQQSAPVSLVAGQKYYIEALHKEGSQGDHLSVGWQIPGGANERPIPANRLIPYSSVVLSSPGSGTVLTPGVAVTMSAVVTGSGAQKVMFFSNNSFVAEDAGAPYAVQWTPASPGSYTLQAQLVTNSGTTVSAPVVVTAASAGTCQASGAITREVWQNVPGTSVSDIPVQNAPSAVSQLSSFQSPTESADNYGQRIRGYVCAPYTGSYVFYIASDDNSELWLSTNDQPAGKTKIASVTGWTFPGEWAKYPSQQSTPVNLVAGQRYYIEALHKEGDQGDHLAVGWLLPGGVLERPISGSRLSPYAGGLSCTLVSPTDNAAFVQGSAITLSATASGGTIQKVEFYSGTTKLGEDLSAPYSYEWSNAAAGSYTISARSWDQNGASAVSGVARITVSPAQQCAMEGSILREVWYNAPGTSVYDTPLSSSPGATSHVNSFATPAEAGDNYGQRLRGYICPPVTGTYTFWIASDDNSELWISSSDQPSGKARVASVTGWTFPKEWNKYISQKSQGIQLTGGQRYYIEALHKEGTQGDHLAVAWQIPGGAFEGPIPGVRLSPYAVSTVCAASIQPGSATTFCSGGSVTLYANSQSDVSYQWIKDGSNIPGATEHSYHTGVAGNYQVRITSPGCMAWSAPTRVTVSNTLTARITPGGPTTFCEGGNVILYGNTCGSSFSYQWKRNGADIPSANSHTYAASVSGSYQLKIAQGSSMNWSALVEVTVNNCGSQGRLAGSDSTSADTAVIASVADSSSVAPLRLNVYPNPTTGMFTFDFCMEDVAEKIMEIKVYNIGNGTEVYNRPPAATNGCIRENIELPGSLSTGIYLLNIRLGDRIETAKIVLLR